MRHRRVLWPVAEGPQPTVDSTGEHNTLRDMEECYYKATFSSTLAGVMITSLFLNRERAVRNGWWILAFYLVLGICLVGVSTMSAGARPSNALQLMLVFGTTAFLQWMRRRPLGEIIGVPDGRALRGLTLGIVGGLVLMGIPALILLIGGWVHFSVGAADGSAVLTGLLAALTVAALEELVFRGFMFRRLQDGIGLWLTLLITSAYFVLTHMDNPGMTGATKILAGLNIFIASLLFGLALIRSGGLAMPIVLHTIANFVQGSVLGFGVSGNATAGLLQPITEGSPVWLNGGHFGLEASLPGLVTVSAMTIGVYFWRGLPAPDLKNHK
jgi:membrane protease YdiL (CAAX protease family)